MMIRSGVSASLISAVSRRILTTPFLGMFGLMPRRAVPIEDRFWSKVDKNGPIPAHRPDLGPCWSWTGSRHIPPILPYGKFWDGTYTESGNPRMIGAHIWAFKHFVEDLGDLWVLHHCDAPFCVRYEGHLFSGSPSDNNQDTADKLRRPHGSAHHSSKLTEEIVQKIRSSSLSRAALAEHHDLAWSTINKIIGRKIWKHV
jgi:hypothetical protein